MPQLVISKFLLITIHNNIATADERFFLLSIKLFDLMHLFSKFFGSEFLFKPSNLYEPLKVSPDISESRLLKALLPKSLEHTAVISEVEQLDKATQNPSGLHWEHKL